MQRRTRLASAVLLPGRGRKGHAGYACRKIVHFRHTLVKLLKPFFRALLEREPQKFVSASARFPPAWHDCNGFQPATENAAGRGWADELGRRELRVRVVRACPEIDFNAT